MNSSTKMSRGTVVPALVSGLIFAAGLGIGGMTNPNKVKAFLDVSGDWDPSLAFVMAGAIAVYSLGYRFVMRATRPYCGHSFSMPSNTAIDGKLAVGAIMFGLGWGLAGYCPGPALVSVGTLSSSAVLFVGAMLAGMFLFDRR